jgi:stage IV sporulation protein FB
MTDLLTQPMSSLFERWLGFHLRIHPLFILLLFFSLLTGYVLEVITLFSIVFIHELGHIAAAKSYQWRIREVQLTPFGGVALMDDDGAIPAHEEVIVSISGPFMNLVMVALAYMLYQFRLWSSDWTDYFVQANLILCLFNLLPILPLDGGRVLRACLSFVLPYYQTLQRTSSMSIWVSAFIVGICIAGFAFGKSAINYMIMAIFLVYSNWHEKKMTPFRFIRFLLFREQRVKQWLQIGKLAKPILTHPHAPIYQVVQHFMREKPHVIIIMNHQGNVVGLMEEKRIVDCYLERARNQTISDLFLT